MKRIYKLSFWILFCFISLFGKKGIGQYSYKNLNSGVSTGPEKGTLIITGDGIYGVFQEKFMELIGGPDAPIIVIPTALSSLNFSKTFLKQYKQKYIDLGFNNVTVLHTRDPEEANTEEFIRPIKKAVGIIFDGGRQWRLADSYLNTKTHQEFFNLLDRGGVIAGGSAGATIQGSYLARGDSRGNTKMMGDHEEGLGFITNVAIDQHLFARNRQFDMFEILDHRPKLLGIGLDERAGIVVQGSKFTVIGDSYVAIYDGTRWSREKDTVYQLAPGSREFYILKPGDQYDLELRATVTYKNRKFLKLKQTDLQKFVGNYLYSKASLESTIFIQNGILLMKVDSQTFEILPSTETRFYISGTNFYFDFIKDSNDNIIGIYESLHKVNWLKLK